MKTLLLLLSTICLSQMVKAQVAPIYTIKQLVNYESRKYPKELQLSPSHSVKKFYNLHIVRNFPTLFAVTAEALSIKDDNMLSEEDVLHTASADISKEKAILKNIAWTNTKNKK